MLAWLLGLWIVYLFITPDAASTFTRFATVTHKTVSTK